MELQERMAAVMRTLIKHYRSMQEAADGLEISRSALQDYLSAWCFGDTYTRGGMDLQTRELLTLVCILALGGCDPQVRAHVGGNLAVGNGRETLIAAICQCLPYIGFPRTLNALAAVNELTK